MREPEEAGYFSVAGRFLLIEAFELKLTFPACESFPLNTEPCSIQLPFKTGCAVHNIYFVLTFTGGIIIQTAVRM